MSNIHLLNKALHTVLHPEKASDKLYLYGTETSDWQVDSKKKIHLNEVFQLAIQSIQSNTIKADDDSTSETSNLLESQRQTYQELKDRGEELYSRYTTPNHVFKRTILKILYFCFSRFFPISPKENERLTQQAFTDYTKEIETQIHQINEKIDQITKQQELEKKQEEEKLSQIKKQEELEKKQEEQEKKHEEEVVNKLSVNLEALKSQRLPFRKFKELLKQLQTHVKLLESCPKSSPTDLLIRAKFDPTLIPIVLEKSQQLEDHLNNNDDSALAKLLRFTALGDFIFPGKFILNQKQEVVKTEATREVKLQTIQNQTAINFPSRLFKFNGIIKTEPNAVAIQLLGEILEEHKDTCLPSCLEIKFDPAHTESLSPEMMKALLQLAPNAEDIPAIYLDGVTTIDMQSSLLSKEEKEKFFKLLATRLEHADVKTIALPPFKGSAAEEWEKRLTLYSSKSIHLDLSETNITNAQLIQWMERGLLDNVHTLNLDLCPLITTDLIPHLAKLPKLWQLTLPEKLKTGEKELNTTHLPTFTNPFLISQFYVRPECLRHLARDLYDGPTAWASVFQIPLARLGASSVFSNEKDYVLDPQSLANWLHQEDFKSLKAEKAVTTLIFDYCKEINDNNLIDFVKRFPKVTRISLYHCPNITKKGIKALKEYNQDIREVKIRNIEEVPLNSKLPETNQSWLCETSLEQILTMWEQQKLVGIQQQQENGTQQQQKLVNIQHKLFAHLFGDSTQEKVKDFLNIPIDPASDAFRDTTLIFKKFDDAISEEHIFKVHKNILYSQSPLFRDEFRPEGDLFNQLNPEKSYINANISIQVCQALIDLMYGKGINPNLGWKTLAEMAEFSKTEIFRLPYHKEILEAFYSKFDVEKIMGSNYGLTQIDDMIVRAIQLEDKEGLIRYERKLTDYVLEHPQAAPDMASLASQRGLNNLSDLANQIVATNM